MKDEGGAGVLRAGWGTGKVARASCLRDEGDFNHEWAGIFTNGEGTGNGVRGAGVRDGGFLGKMGGRRRGGDNFLEGRRGRG